MKKNTRTRKDKGAIDAESIIVRWAKAGVLAEAGRAAIARSHAQGRSVTIAEEGIVYHLHPDGSRTRVRTIPTVPAGKYTQHTFKVKL